MTINFGAVPANSVLPIYWTSHDAATGANETMSALAVGDILIYKGTSITQRSSTSGFALIDTDGIDVDTLTGVNAISIDLSDNTDAGFYAVGSFYTVVLGPITIDAQTVYTVLATFRIVAAEGITGEPKVDVDGWLGTAAATPTVAGVPEVDLTHVAGSTASVSTIASSIATLLAAIGTLTDAAADGDPTATDTLMQYVKQLVNVLVGSAGIVTFPAGAAPANAVNLAEVLRYVAEFVDTEVAAIKAKTDNLPADPADASDVAALIDALPTAAENADAVWDEAVTDHVAAGSFGQGAQATRIGTAQAGASGTITLDASASGSDSFYNNLWIAIVSGTGADQVRKISAYVGATKVATITPSWATTPDSTSVFAIFG